MAKKIILFLAIDYQVIMRIYSLVFILVEEEVVVAGVVGPDVFDAFVDLALIFDLLEILYHLHRSNEGKETRSHSIASAWKEEFGCLKKNSLERALNLDDYDAWE